MSSLLRIASENESAHDSVMSEQERMDKLKGMKSDEMMIFMPPREREFLYTVPTDGRTPKRLTDKDIAALMRVFEVSVKEVTAPVFGKLSDC